MKLQLDQIFEISEIFFYVIIEQFWYRYFCLQLDQILYKQLDQIFDVRGIQL